MTNKAFFVAWLCTFRLQSYVLLYCHKHLETMVFKEVASSTVSPTPENIKHYESYIERFVSALRIPQDAQNFL
ncbi:hypothetical protein FEZ33_12050 [Ruoffia tabacinasalis]|uniref:Uncharacterized protein n=1 Tax=Ruoffia tabacinasalis TaxID=87458 RepID=A0A5R9DSD3_9LACT|nr:hypothetical protein FEZ33_12050 [Ruoffia tabacinasalis]